VGQRRIDQIVTCIKDGQAATEAMQPPIASPSPPPARTELMDDLIIIGRLLGDLQKDLLSSPQTVEDHGAHLQHLEAVMRMLSSDPLVRLPATQFVEGLGETFELLGRLEDEISSNDATLGRHGYKLQHLDLAMQMLEELAAASLIGDSEQPSGPSRLPRLRTACELALQPK
jgi:hypothetical protein